MWRFSSKWATFSAFSLLWIHNVETLQVCIFSSIRYYDCDNSEKRFLPRYRALRRIRQGLIRDQGSKKMMEKFEPIFFSLSLAPGKGDKFTFLDIKDVIALQQKKELCKAHTRKQYMSLCTSNKIIMVCGVHYCS